MAEGSEAPPLPFEVIFCSGWEVENPPADLVPKSADQLSTSVVGNGWQTAKNSAFPQVLIIRFQGTTPKKVEKLQILSHHFKIASAIDFYACAVSPKHFPPPQANVSPAIMATLVKDLQFTKLGYVSLSQNKASNFKTRELKVVHVDVTANLLKLVVHKPWSNALNVGNQIGIAGLTVLGREPLQVVSGDTQIHQLVRKSTSTATPVAASPEIAAPPSPLKRPVREDESHLLIRALERFKAQMISDEQYVMAKTLTGMLLIASRASEEIARLNSDKQKAVESEDFDHADALKQDVQQIRSAVTIKLASEGFIWDAAANTVRYKAPKPVKAAAPVVQRVSVPVPGPVSVGASNLGGSSFATPTGDAGDGGPRRDMSTRRDSEGISASPLRDDIGGGERQSEEVSAARDGGTLPARQANVSDSLPSRYDERPVGKSSLPPGLTEYPPEGPPPDTLGGGADAGAVPDGPPKPKKQFLKRGTGKNALGQAVKSSVALPGDAGEEPKQSEPPLTKKPSMVRGQSNVGAGEAKAVKRASPAHHQPVKEVAEEISGPPSPSRVRNKIVPVSTPSVRDTPPEDPPPLSVDWATSCSGVYDIFEPNKAEAVLACLGAKKFPLLEWALSSIKDCVVSTGQSNKDAMVNAAFQVIRKSLQDSREKVITQTLDIWAAVNDLTPRPASIPRLTSTALPNLLSKLGDISPRTRKAAMDFCLTLFRTFPDGADYSIWKEYIAPIDAKKGEKTPPKVVVGRLEMVNRCIAEIGPPKGATSNVVGFCGPFVLNSDGKVREAAHALVVTCGGRLGAQKTRSILLPIVGDSGPALKTLDALIAKLPTDRSGSFDDLPVRAAGPLSRRTSSQELLGGKADAGGGGVANGGKKAPLGLKKQASSKAVVGGGGGGGAPAAKKPASKGSAPAPRKDAEDERPLKPAKSAGKSFYEKAAEDEDTDGDAVSLHIQKSPFKKPLRARKPTAQHDSSEYSHTEAEAMRGEEADVVVVQDGPLERGVLAGGNHQRTKSKSRSRSRSQSQSQSPHRKVSTAVQEASSEILSEMDMRTCIFCGLHDEGFSEDALDAHYWSQCPMLSKCGSCKLTVEIPNLFSHILHECEMAADHMRACNLCGEPIDENKPGSHVCLGPYPANSTRCPMCRALLPLPAALGESELALDDYEELVAQSWKDHITGGKGAAPGTGCKGNPRVLMHQQRLNARQRQRSEGQAPAPKPRTKPIPPTAKGPLSPSRLPTTTASHSSKTGHGPPVSQSGRGRFPSSNSGTGRIAV